MKTWNDTGLMFLWEVWNVKLKKEVVQDLSKFRNPTDGTWIAEMKNSRM